MSGRLPTPPTVGAHRLTDASLWRRLASAVVPDTGKRAIDAVRNRATMAMLAPTNRAFVQRHGLEVSAGPFTGLRYPPGLEATQGDLISKLLGTYEAELHPAVSTWLGDDLTHVLNVGCAEGYYAVGLARALTTATVIAYDISPVARAECARLASLNAVGNQLQIRGECTPETFDGHPDTGVGLLCDCEGYEKTLLDPERAPKLRGWSILVELHDFMDPAITDTIVRRFEETHEIQLIASAPRDMSHPELEFLAPRTRRLVLRERPVMMRWGFLSPRR